MRIINQPMNFFGGIKPFSMKKITTKREALDAFIAEFGSLARALNPAAPSYDGYNFVKATIRVKDSEEFVAYIAHNLECQTTFVVPVNGETPTIVNFTEVKVIRRVNTEKQAVDAFVMEFGCLARALNPAATAYDGYKFVKHKITIENGDTLKAWIASNTEKKHMLVVPVNGDTPLIEDFEKVKLLD